MFHGAFWLVIAATTADQYPVAVNVQLRGDYQWLRASARRPWILTGALAVTTLALVLAHPYVESLLAPPIPLALKVSDVSGSLSVRWDVAHPAVVRTQEALVEVHDRGHIIRARLDRTAVRHGSFTYPRRSSDVLVMITMLRDSQPVATAMVRSIGP